MRPDRVRRAAAFTLTALALTLTACSNNSSSSDGWSASTWSASTSLDAGTGTVAGSGDARGVLDSLSDDELAFLNDLYRIGWPTPNDLIHDPPEAYLEWITKIVDSPWRTCQQLLLADGDTTRVSSIIDDAMMLDVAVVGVEHFCPEYAPLDINPRIERDTLADIGFPIDRDWH